MQDNTTRNHILALSITTALITGVVSFEGGYVKKAYYDVVGVPTIGAGTTVYPSGKRVSIGDIITEQQAKGYLIADLEVFRKGFMQCVNALLTQNEFNAYMSLIYNIGVTAFCSSSIPSKLEAGNYTAACLTILEFNKARDKTKPKVYNKRKMKWEFPLVVVKGLDNRRKVEYRTCITPDPKPLQEALQ
jgi:GH24 family phage-related lysozyme (muramidase)